MPVLEQVRDDQRNKRSEEPQARLDDKPVDDQTAVAPIRRKASLVAPPSLEPGDGVLDESSAVLCLVESEAVAVEGQHVEQQEPTPEDHSTWGDVGGQRLVIASTRHVNKRVQFEVHTLHRGHQSPHVVHIGVELRSELDLDRTLHGTSMTPQLNHPHPARRGGCGPAVAILR